VLGKFFPEAIRRSPVGDVLRKIGKPLMPGWVDEGRKVVQGHQLAMLVENAGPSRLTARRVLNAGAGEGLYTRLLLEKSPDAKVIEIDLGYANHHRAVENIRQTIAAASLTAIPFVSECFDFVLCSEVLEHIKDDETALEELIRVVTRGGHLLISVPTPPAVFDKAHVREGYKPDDLTKMLEDRGMRVLETRFCMHRIFQFFLKTQRNGPTPKIMGWTLSRLDRILRIGTPQDLMILSRRDSTPTR
jgi:SAM-dependent methyltransferase